MDWKNHQMICTFAWCLCSTCFPIEPFLRLAVVLKKWQAGRDVMVRDGVLLYFWWYLYHPAAKTDDVVADNMLHVFRHLKHTKASWFLQGGSLNCQACFKANWWLWNWQIDELLICVHIEVLYIPKKARFDMDQRQNHLEHYLFVCHLYFRIATVGCGLCIRPKGSPFFEPQASLLQPWCWGG